MERRGWEQGVKAKSRQGQAHTPEQAFARLVGRANHEPWVAAALASLRPPLAGRLLILATCRATGSSLQSTIPRPALCKVSV
jgi:hypothetical protein